MSLKQKAGYNRGTMAPGLFDDEYRKLNPAQKEAVDTIDGPVMVVAGPGTGKTQILALRIGNILKKTDVGADSILCLTFTNSAVRAMRERLQKYIGEEGGRVEVLTFHSFCGKIIDEFFHVLSLPFAPRILEDTEAVSLCDQILRQNEWQYLRPRGDIGRHFKELRSLVSLLKRERLSPRDFLDEIEKEIQAIQNDPESISSRGETKGKMKKEYLEKIEGLERTKEIVSFYDMYEKLKQEKGLLDYDDQIKYALQILEESENARAEIQVRYLYVLVDEHQDSSGAQNALLKTIWQKVEKPNIFAVGDDRQLIYAFGGAKFSYFEEFKDIFGKAKVIFLTQNYRSTQKILAAADKLLSSSFSEEKLVATLKENHNLKLFECDYPRDEVIACGIELKEKLLSKEVKESDCAILVPKNTQAREAMRVLGGLGIKVAGARGLSLFATAEFSALLRVFKICANIHDPVPLAESILDPVSGIPRLAAHSYLYQERGKTVSLQDMAGQREDLFGSSGTREIKEWGEKLLRLVSFSSSLDMQEFVQKVGDEVLLKTAKGHTELLERIEVVRSVLHLALSFAEKENRQEKNSLPGFIAFIERLREYGEDFPLASFKSDEGVKVITLHASKGLEFDFVWVAHLDEGSLMKGRRRNFRLPESVALKVEEKDEAAAKRELYVAITRAKRFCRLSYPRFSYSGREQELAKIVSELAAANAGQADSVFEKLTFSETEEKILSDDPKNYVASGEKNDVQDTIPKLLEMVSKEYAEVNVSVSLLNNFFECPRKWYFRNLLKLPEPKNETLEFGSRVHAAMEKILKFRKPPSGKDLEEIAQGEKGLLRIISRWVKERFAEINPDRETEKSVSVRAAEFPRLSIYGKIDLVEKLGERDVRVTDFKTGSVRKKSDIEKINEDPAFTDGARGRMSDYMRQLAMYSFLLERSSKGRVSVNESRLEFLEAKDGKESVYSTTIGRDRFDLLLQDIKDYETLVKTGKWLDRPCDYKSFLPAGRQVTNSCEYCEMMKRIYKTA